MPSHPYRCREVSFVLTAECGFCGLHLRSKMASDRGPFYLAIQTTPLAAISRAGETGYIVHMYSPCLLISLHTAYLIYLYFHLIYWNISQGLHYRYIQIQNILPYSTQIHHEIKSVYKFDHSFDRDHAGPVRYPTSR